MRVSWRLVKEPMLSSSYDLLLGLKRAGYLREDAPKYWWPNVGEFEVVVGTILTQQSRWENVEKSLVNLKSKGILTLEGIVSTNAMELAELIKPSGFYNQKSKRLKELSQNIIESFGNFEQFKESVDREWLLSQKGVGEESADSILCYGCKREVMVVDAYTQRLVRAFGYEFESYGELQEWVVDGVESNYSKIVELYDEEIELFTIFSRFHGKIVEFVKENSKKKEVLVSQLKELL